jgi:hypothetical protein
VTRLAPGSDDFAALREALKNGQTSVQYAIVLGGPSPCFVDARFLHEVNARVAFGDGPDVADHRRPQATAIRRSPARAPNCTVMLRDRSGRTMTETVEWTLRNAKAAEARTKACWRAQGPRPVPLPFFP